MKDRIENIEKRLDRLERMIEQIIAPPPPTNLVGLDIALQIQRTLERRFEVMKYDSRTKKSGE